MAQLIWIISNKYEDASKISMYRTTDLLFTFLFQYFFLGIESNELSILGSIFIASGVLVITLMKIIEKRSNEKMDNGVSKSNCFKKLITYKF